MLRNVLTICFLLLIVNPVFSSVPNVITHQGYLTDSSGVALTGSTQMTFSLYTVETGGTAIWTEPQTAQVNNGVYAVALGSVTPLDPAQIDGDLWLGVTVGTDSEMTPRQKLNSVAFALRAGDISGNLSQSRVDGLPDALDSIYQDLCDLYRSTSTTPPSGCDAYPDSTPVTKRVFVTSQGYTGALGGLAGADAKCQMHANSVGFGGTYKAWISDNATSAAVRLFHSNTQYINESAGVQYVVANNWDDIVDGSILANILYDENGNAASGNVWTNTKADGIKFNTTINGDVTCYDWTSGSWALTSQVGSVTGDTATGAWTNLTSRPCDRSLRLYCFEQ